MHAIAMVHKMQRLALVSSNSMDIDEKRIGAIQEEDEGSCGDVVLILLT